MHYPPHVRLTSDVESGFVTEGSKVLYTCEAHANPTQMTFAWYVGGRRVPEAHSSQLVLDKVARNMHNHVVKCEVSNPIGKTEESTLINIACKLVDPISLLLVTRSRPCRHTCPLLSS